MIIIILSSIIFIFRVLQAIEIIMNVKIIENNFKGGAKKAQKRYKLERTIYKTR